MVRAFGELTMFETKNQHDMTTTIQHHLDAATLLSYSAGSLPEALAAVVAAHLGMCAHCAAAARHMDDIGAALFAKLAPASLSQSAPVMELRRQEADTGVAVELPSAGANSEVPPTLARLIDGTLDAVPWRRLGLGVWHHRLQCSDGDLRLLKVAAGRRMPEHGHGGCELTLMLRGNYADHTGIYRPGDVADLDANIEHMPIADAQVGCICLIASEKPAKFKNFIPRLVQPLTGM